MSKEFRLTCLQHCLQESPDALVQCFKLFCKLSNHKLPGAPIDMMIDQATGRNTEIINQFTFFLAKYVYLPLLRQQRKIRYDK